MTIGRSTLSSDWYQSEEKVHLAPSHWCTRTQDDPMCSRQEVCTGRMTRWGLENLNLDQKMLDGMGFAGVMRPVQTSCLDHMGSSWVRVHQWDGAKWTFSSDWYQSDDKVLRPMVMLASGKYAEEKKLTPRTPEQCKM